MNTEVVRDRTFIEGLFSSPEEQIERLCRRMPEIVHGSGAHLAYNMMPYRRSPDQPLLALTLCWTGATLQQTVDTKLVVLRQIYGDRFSVKSLFRTGPERLKIVAGAPAFEPHRIWWQLIDLGTYQQVSPARVPLEVAAGVEIFDVVMQHPAYVAQMDGDNVPYLSMPALRVNFPGDDPWSNAPGIAGGDGEVRVDVAWANWPSKQASGPVLV